MSVKPGDGCALPVPPQQLPAIMRADEILPKTTQQIEAKRQLITRIITTTEVAEATFENVARPLIELENVQSGERAVIDALKYCAPDIDTQRAAEKAEALWEEEDSNLTVELYQLFRIVRRRNDFSDSESRKYIDRMCMEYEKYGYGLLDAEGIKRCRERISRIQQLSTEFNRILRQHDGGEFFSPEELEGVPEKDRQPSMSDGRIFSSYDSGYHSIMRHANLAETRRRMQEGYHSQFSENVPKLQEIILLRDENARELGFSSHAAAKLPYRSIESLEWIDEVMDQLVDAMLPIRRADFEEIARTKRRYLKENPASRDDYGDSIMPWDIFYYSAILQHEHRVDHAAIAEYFPLRHTFSVMLETFAKCLRLHFTPMHVGDHLWHEHVQAWSVWEKDETGADCFAGYLFADLVGRPNKYKGNQSVNLQPGFVRSDGTRVYPANVLMCNFHETNKKTGCLLAHHNVVTLLHELGHSIHDLVARTKYARHHGYAVTLEYGEAIATALEHWCWHPTELKAISLHYTRINATYKEAWISENSRAALPPEKISDDLLEPCLARRKNVKVERLMSSLLMAKFDLALHNPLNRHTLLHLDTRKLYKELYERLLCRPLPNLSNLHVSAGHLLSGYDAGYYAYVCAEIFGADLFYSAFAEDTRSQASWDRFRRVLLQPGGSRHELQMLKEFLGRPPNTEALLSIFNTSTKLPQ